MTVYIVDIESIPTRYTCQWKTHIPKLISSHGHEVYVIAGPDDLPDNTTPGMFLNFAATNIYKAAQIEKFSRLFSENKIKDGDHFIFTDAWHPGVINLKYMADLLNIKIKIFGLWHAGSYDKWDGLGRLVGDKPWVRNAEGSMFYCYDVNWFATEFHAKLMLKTLYNETDIEQWNHWHADKPGKVQLTGWPMDYLYDLLEPYSTLEKKPQIVFPHRIAPEKQLEIFKDLAAAMPQYKWIVCQEQTLSKDQYHTILGESAMMFSANLQESFGISTIESLICNAFPMVPDRLSYSEMYTDTFKYPSSWTEDWEHYTKHKDQLIAHIHQNMQKILNKDNELFSKMQDQLAQLRSFTSAGPLVASLAS